MQLPTGTRCAVHSSPAMPGGAMWTVIAAAAPIEPQPDALSRRGQLSAFLTHDAGLTWPDAMGVALAEAVLAEGGAVAFGFAALADAMACAAMLRRAGAQ